MRPGGSVLKPLGRAPAAMVSQLKQQMRRARTGIPPAPRGERVQILELHGRLDLKLGKREMAAGAPELEGKTFYVGAWLSTCEFRAAQRMGDGSISLALPIDTHADFDTVKLQLYCLMTDPETRLRKPFPIDDAVACVRQLSACKPVKVDFLDPIMGLGGGSLTLTAKQPVDTSRLRRSAMYRVDESNGLLKEMSDRVGKALQANQVRVPKAAEGFIQGLGYLPSGGNPTLGIPAVMTHYGMLSALVDGVDRYLPHAVLAYYLQLVLTHKGLSVDEALALPGAKFASLTGEVLWGVTQTAGGFPYEPDRTLVNALTLDPKKGISVALTLTTTEDISLSFAAPSFIGRDLNTRAAPDLSQLPELPAGAAAPADPRAFFQAHASALHAREHEEQNIALGMDDCENSGIAGKLAANTVRDKDMGAGAFLQGLEFNPAGRSDFHIFKSWTTQDVDKASAFFTRAQTMMKKGELNISLVVGLAGGASATTDNTAGRAKDGQPAPKSIDDMQDLGGHCFAVLRHTGADGAVYVRLLEGTSCVQAYHDKPDGPHYSVSVGYAGAKDKARGKRYDRQMPMSSFLTLLSTSVSEATRVVNEVIGEGGTGADGGGLKGAQRVAGFVRPTIVMPCLHSLNPTDREGSELGFYKWCMFTGLAGDPGDFGTLPLEEGEYAQCLGAGCRPVSLASRSLKGVGLEMESKKFEVSRDVLNEVWPPIASHAQFRAVLALWAPLAPLSSVNADLSGLRKPGVEYETVTCMEAPASPAVAPIVYRLKAALARLANEINLARPDSDGVTMSVAHIGTGVDSTLHVPVRTTKLTFSSSLREAQNRMGWNVREKTAG